MLVPTSVWDLALRISSTCFFSSEYRNNPIIASGLPFGSVSLGPIIAIIASLVFTDSVIKVNNFNRSSEENKNSLFRLSSVFNLSSLFLHEAHSVDNDNSQNCSERSYEIALRRLIRSVSAELWI